MIFNISGFTHKGTSRKINQDRILINGELMEDGVLDVQNQVQCSCFVADGVGGNKKGEFASQFVLENLKEQISLDFNQLTERLKKINLDLIETSSKDDSITGTATTLTGMFIDNDHFYVCHSGDSELWLLRNNMFSKVTTDQVLDDSANSPITSFFGGEADNLNFDLSISLTASEMNDYYLICSDGLFKSLESTEVKKVLNENSSVNDKVRYLQEKCLSNGAPDNVSVIIIHRTAAESIPEANQINQENNNKNENSTGVISTNYTDTPTGVVGGSHTDKTGVISAQTSNSTGVIDEQQKKSDKQEVSLHGLVIGDIIQLKEVAYAIKDIISEGTGEASVYLVENPHSKVLALKMYKEFDNPKHEPNPEALARIMDINNTDILKLYDYGVGLDKYQGKYCFEICDYAEGGDLQKYSEDKEVTIEFIENQLIPEIFQGIKLLHENRIFHCDIKPGNIFLFDKDQKDVVIGDYGSAKTFDKDSEVDIQSTTTVKGTNIFMAPEQGRGHVSEKNDYYSLGMVLLSILYPEQIKSFRDITIRQSKGVKIIEYKKKFQRINNLIEGLTLNSFENRFGKKEVEKWLKGEEVNVHYAGLNTAVVPLKIGGGKLIETGDDFVAVIEKDDKWYEKYIENGASWPQILIWLNSYSDMQARSIFEGIRKHYEIEGEDFLKEAFIRFFQPSRTIRIDMVEFDFHNSSDLKKEVDGFIAKLDEIWKFTNWKTLRFYLFQCEFSLRQLSLIHDSPVIKALIDKLLAIFGIESNKFDELKADIHTKINERNIQLFNIQLLELFYSFNAKRGYRDYKNQEYKTLQDLGFFYIKEPQLFNNDFLIIEKKVFLDKQQSSNLSFMEYKVFIFEIFKNNAQTEVEFISMTFDKYRNQVLHYKFFKSLNQFLISKNIHSDFTDRSEINISYSGKRKLFWPFWKYADDVLAELCAKHNIFTLTTSNKAEFKKKFVFRSILRHAYIYSGQALAFIILSASFYFGYLLLTNKLSLDEHWHFYWGNKPKIDQVHVFYKTEKESICFSPNYPIDCETSTRIPKKGTELELIGDVENEQWQKVIYRGEIGYVSVGTENNKYLSYSRTFQQ
jgi:serine/threonine protein phosphatase PrpC/serine/threonine protein kinase